MDVKHHVDSLGAELFPNGCFLDTVFVTLFRTAVETIQVVSHWRGPHPLLKIVLLAVADGLLGLYGLERWDELLTGTRPPTPLTPLPSLPPSLISHTVYVDVKHHERKKETLLKRARADCVFQLKLAVAKPARKLEILSLFLSLWQVMINRRRKFRVY